MSAPDLTKKVIGFRHWTDAEGALSSTGVAGIWGRGVNEARCGTGGVWMPRPAGVVAARRDKHVAPDHDCQCGLYALHDPPEGELGRGPWNTVQVLGAVAAWGRIEVHHAGFRAQYAEIIALAYNEAWPKKLLRSVADLAESYDVLVVEAAQLAARAAEVAEPVPMSLRPEKPEHSPPGDFAFYGHPITFSGSSVAPSVQWTELRSEKKKRWWQR